MTYYVPALLPLAALSELTLVFLFAVAGRKGCLCGLPRQSLCLWSLALALCRDAAAPLVEEPVADVGKSIGAPFVMKRDSLTRISFSSDSCERYLSMRTEQE